jgi:RNA polymerase sigma-70 factor (ECF subfamily)
LLLLRADAERITQALEKLPLPFREILVLRELEELSYREIADLMRIPLGTVMSRLARARHLLSQHLTGKAP